MAILDDHPEMRGRSPVLEAWLDQRAAVFGTTPPALEAAALLDAFLADGSAAGCGLFVSAFVAACGDLDVAVAHLLALRRLVDLEELEVLIVDATRTVLAEARQAARVDSLTGIGNRAALDAQLPSALARAERSGRDVTVVFFDLVGLRAMNERFGAESGDAALVAFARAVDDVKRTGDGAYRLGGDEFVVVLADTAGDDVADVFVSRLRASTAPRFEWGVSRARADGFDAARLIRLADLRMLEARYRPR